MTLSVPKRRLALAAAGILALVAVAEGACRILFADPPALRREDAVYFRMRFPAEPQTVVLKSPAGREIRYEVGADGFRGRLAMVPERKTGKRVLVLGSASTFGLGLGETETFPSRLEQKLRALPGCAGAEVLNAGAPGANAADMLGRYISDLQRFAPDAVIVYHDWTELTSLADGRPSEAQAEEGRDLSRRFAVNGPLGELASVRAAMRLLMKARFGLDVHQGNFSPARPMGAPTGVPPVERVPAEGLRRFEVTLRALVAGIQASGARAYLIPELTLLSAEMPPSLRSRVWVSDNFGAAARLEALVRLREAMASTARMDGATLIDLEAGLGAKESLLMDHVHLNPQGAALVAERIAAVVGKALCR